MTPAAQYLRVSSDHQEHSLSAQSAQIADFAAAHGYQIVRSYEDRGRSGLRLKGRAALQALLADIVSGEAVFEAVLVQDVSRWGRFQDTDEAAHYEYVCRAAGVEICYCREPFEAGRSGDLVKAVKRLMAADFSRELSAKVRAAQFHRARAGWKMGGLAGYGLRRAIIGADGQIKAVLEPGEQPLLRGDRIRLVPGPAHEVATVRRIFRMFLEDGMGQGAIAETLNAERIAGEGARPWASWTVGNLLENPKYAGTYRFGRRRRTLEGQRLDSPPDAALQVENAWPAIVPAAWLAAAVQRRRRRMLFLPRAEILRRLSARAAQAGGLTRAAIDACPDLPSARTCQTRLGPWRRICARLGLYPAFIPGQIDKRRASTEWAKPQRGRLSMALTYTAFVGPERLAQGDLQTVARAAHAAQDRQAEMPIVFEDASGTVVDLDLRGSPEDLAARLRATAALPASPAAPAPRGRGRPKLGVTAREVTLLPRHWDWLQQQPGGASAALRRLVEQAQQDNAEIDKRRAAQTAAYRVMYALAGHLAGYEEALRALYAADASRFQGLTSPWPADVRAYVQKLAAPSFPPAARDGRLSASSS
jgi:DNA invertase Pin-like site-specific DNA recombinase